MRFKKFILLFCIIFSDLLYGDTEVKLEQKKYDFEYFKVYDPLEAFNRRVYYFNYYFDKYLFFPVIDTYEFITPKIFRTGVHNLFENTQNINTTANSILQGKVSKSMRSIGRFTINITFGFFGLFDVASELGMPRPYEDFGMTLAFYNIGEGPYLVLPVLGPSNLRDGFGTAVDMATKTMLYHVGKLNDLNHYGITILRSIDKRENIKFRYYEMETPFEYDYVRFLYTKFRRMQIQINNK